jgi:hypothetical protein
MIRTDLKQYSLRIKIKMFVWQSKGKTNREAIFFGKLNKGSQVTRF